MFDYVDGLDIITCHNLSWFQLYFLDVLHEMLGVFRWCGDWPTKGQMMLANSLATPYVMDPLLETMGLRGCQFYVFWGGHKIWGGSCSSRVHLPVTEVTELSLVFDVPECLGESVF